MNILHINCNYLGTPLHQNMINSLSGKGVDSTVFVPISNRYEVRVKPNSNVVVSECFQEFDRLFYGLKQKKIYRSVLSKIDVNSFDVIHAYTLFTDGNVAMNLSKKYGKPFVVAIRDTDISSFFKKRKYLKSKGIEIMKCAKAIFFLSPQGKKKVMESYVPQELQECIDKKSYIIPNGIDSFWHNNEWKPHKARKDKELKLVYAGRVMKRKNIGGIIKCADILEEKGYHVRLDIVGKIVDRDLYEEAISRQYVVYSPAKPKEELISSYRENDIFIMPSFQETFGMVYPEAMSQGLPVIYSKGQGFDGQFEEGEVGYSVIPEDAENIANAVIRVVENYDLISENCVRNSRIFDWDLIVEKYTQIYSKIV